MRLDHKRFADLRSEEVINMVHTPLERSNRTSHPHVAANAACGCGELLMCNSAAKDWRRRTRSPPMARALPLPLDADFGPSAVVRPGAALFRQLRPRAALLKICSLSATSNVISVTGAQIFRRAGAAASNI